MQASKLERAELAHYPAARLWGPWSGDEAAAGIMHTPKAFNVIRQGAVERLLKDLRPMLQALGGEVWQKAVGSSHLRNLYGGNVRASVECFVELRVPGLPTKHGFITMSVGPPPKGRVFEVNRLDD